MGLSSWGAGVDWRPDDGVLSQLMIQGLFRYTRVRAYTRFSRRPYGEFLVKFIIRLAVFILVAAQAVAAPPVSCSRCGTGLRRRTRMRFMCSINTSGQSTFFASDTVRLRRMPLKQKTAVSGASATSQFTALETFRRPRNSIQS